MRLRSGIFRRRRRAIKGHAERTDPLALRILRGALLSVGAGVLIASIVTAPTKRNLEILAAILFLGFALMADPFRALLFVTILIPYPAYTTVGSTSMLLIAAVGGLVLLKGPQLNLPSPFFKRDADLAILGYLLMCTLSWYVQPRAGYTEARFLYFGILSGIAMYYLILTIINTPERLWKLLEITQIMAVSLAVLAMFQWNFPDKQILPAFFKFSQKVAEMEEIRRGQVRVTATFNGQELYAEYVAWSVILQYILFRHQRDLHRKIFWALAALLSLSALFATATRGAFLALVGGFIYMIVVGGRAIPRFQMMKVLFLGVAVFYLALGFVEPLVEFLMQRMETIGMDDGSVQHREVVMRQALTGVVDSPALGHGVSIPAGTFRGGVSKNIHSLYLHLAYTIGLPGLVAFCSLLAILFRNSWRLVRRSALPRDLRELALGLHVAFVIFLVDEVKIEFLRQPMYMHMVWSLFAMMMVLWRLERLNPPGLTGDSVT